MMRLRNIQLQIADFYDILDRNDRLQGISRFRCIRFREIAETYFADGPSRCQQPGSRPMEVSMVAIRLGNWGVLSLLIDPLAFVTLPTNKKPKGTKVGIIHGACFLRYLKNQLSQPVTLINAKSAWSRGMKVKS